MATQAAQPAAPKAGRPVGIAAAECLHEYGLQTSRGFGEEA